MELKSEIGMRPIGFIESCFKEKFGIPRQAGLVSDATAILRLPDSSWTRDAIRGLEGFSHVWIVFVFHHATAAKALVRPPRLGGSRKVGVFASRSPHRPNPIGLSAVRLTGISHSKKTHQLELHLLGGDFLDNTPVLDLKPYLAYADSIPRARMGWIEGELPRLRVAFSPEARAALKAERARYPRLRSLITQMLRLDPRPSFQVRRQHQGKPGYAARILDLDVHWEILHEGDRPACLVTRIVNAG